MVMESSWQVMSLGFSKEPSILPERPWGQWKERIWGSACVPPTDFTHFLPHEGALLFLLNPQLVSMGGGSRVIKNLE